MKTTIIGFPRVGSLRELKFASEAYFRQEISAEELQETAKELRKTHWALQQASGIDWIPTNDFSFYDNMLDTAVLLQRIEGEEEVEKMDALLSLAITGGDFDWI